MIAELVSPHVLVLDDPLPPNGRLSDYQSAMLYRVVDGRYRNLKPTFVSMNVSGPAEADARLSAPVVDRLRHDALCLVCDWPSYRQAWTGSQQS